MFENKFVTTSEYGVSPTFSVFDFAPKTVGRLPGFSFRRLSWSWIHRTYEIRHCWLAEHRLIDFRVGVGARMYFRDRPDLTYPYLPDHELPSQRTEVFFDIVTESGAWDNVWRYIFEYREISALRNAFKVAVSDTKIPWEISLPDFE